MMEDRTVNFSLVNEAIQNNNRERFRDAVMALKNRHAEDMENAEAGLFRFWDQSILHSSIMLYTNLDLAILNALCEFSENFDGDMDLQTDKVCMDIIVAIDECDYNDQKFEPKTVYYWVSFYELDAFTPIGIKFELPLPEFLKKYEDCAEVALHDIDDGYYVICKDNNLLYNAYGYKMAKMVTDTHIEEEW